VPCLDSGERAPYRTWLFGIARNQYLKRLRREQRHRITLAIDGLEALRGGGPDPAEATAARELEAWLWAALAELPEESRTALLLREYEGLSYNEVGGVLGRTAIWCRVTCFRAKERLRNHYLAQSGGMNNVA
jgi:RNA polymerase sigma-70 factor (ECF subfamily)